ncbi:MAG TPA: EfeM/EfeO family lipoprotein [Stellaceae bacterium]|jgi:iron uptake system EfeUOB component EfeO/EfeM
MLQKASVRRPGDRIAQPKRPVSLKRRHLAGGMLAGFCLTTALAAAWAAPAVPPAAGVNLAQSAEQYRPLMTRDIDQSLAGARLLRARLVAGDVAGAQKAWIDSRVGWERAEVFTSGFVPDLDEEIDAWPNALLGFHAIEAKLFGAKRTDLTPETDALILHLEDLDVKIHHLDLLPQRLLNGTARLAYEVGESKAGGGESAFSGTSLNDMRNNVDGIDTAYRTIFAAAVEANDTRLATAIPQKISELKKEVDGRDLKSVDPAKLRARSEELIVLLQQAAPKIGLRSPTLEEIAQ